MPVLSRSFVAICVAVLAACLSTWLSVSFGVPALESLAIGANLFVAAVLVLEVVSVRKVIHRVQSRIDETQAAFEPIEQRINQLGEQVAALGRQQPHKADAASEDIAILGSMVKELADNVADLEGQVAEQAEVLRLATPFAQQQPSPPARPQADAEPPRPAPIAREPEPPAPAAVEQSRAKPVKDTIAAEIVDAIGADRVDTFLQPVVTLPQRKVRSYEVTARLRLNDGSLMPTEEFLPTAEALGIAPVVDLRQFLRAAQIVRRLSAKSRDIQVSMNLAPRSLTAAAFTSAAIESARQSPAIAAQVVFELDQAAVRTLGLPELMGLKSLAEAGYRFCMDQVADLRVDGATLRDRGFAFVKVPASLLLDPLAQTGIEIHASDLGNFLRRNGIELIADGIADEATVRDLLDYDIGLAQGDLFAPTRPVRADVLSEEPPAPPAAATRPRSAAGPSAVSLDGSPRMNADPMESGSSGKAAWRTLARRVTRNDS